MIILLQYLYDYWFTVHMKELFPVTGMQPLQVEKILIAF